MSVKPKVRHLLIIIFISTAVIWLYSTESNPLRLSQQYQRLRHVFSIFRQNVNLDHNQIKTQEIVREEISTTELKIWLHKEETSLDLSTDSDTVSKNGEVSCYPRLFATVHSNVSTTVCGDKNVHGSLRHQKVPVQHVFFLKTHKTGSQTLTNILNRYALAHNLSVAVRRVLQGHAAQGTKNWIPDIREPPAGVAHYDMITDHVRFAERCVRHFLPDDAVFVSAVRDPLEAFVSAFYYSRDVWSNAALKRIPGPDPVLTYLSDMKRWDTGYGSLTHSRMAYDFGLDRKFLQDPHYLETSIRNLSQVFHLVMLTEAFDESLVLLKRTLSWTLPDMLYVKFNVGKTRHSYNFTEKQKTEFEKHRKEEYAIYRHFRSAFYEKVGAEDETFAEELKVFKALRAKVESFCKDLMASPRKLELRVEGTRFSERFRVCLEDCRLLLRESSSVKDVWFERLMLQRLQNWSKTWQEGRHSSNGR